MLIEKTAKGIVLERYMIALRNRQYPTEDILHDIIALLLWEEQAQASYEQGLGVRVAPPYFRIPEVWKT